jgi:hypothetical protein
VVAADALILLDAGKAFVVKALVLVLTELVQDGVLENAIAVKFTTLLAPAVLNADVVNVPVPGLPAVKLMLAVVVVTVFVPLTLYVTV